MNTKIEVLKSLTKEQKEEFDNDIQTLILRDGIEYDFDSTKKARVKANIRLKGMFSLLLFYFIATKAARLEVI
jgi:hypothetical protein